MLHRTQVMRFEIAKASGGDPHAHHAISLGAGLPLSLTPPAPAQQWLWVTTQRYFPAPTEERSGYRAVLIGGDSGGPGGPADSSCGVLLGPTVAVRKHAPKDKEERECDGRPPTAENKRGRPPVRRSSHGVVRGQHRLRSGPKNQRR